MKKPVYLIALLATFTSCVCDFDDCNKIYGKGEVMSEDRYVGDFTEVESQIAANVEVIESDDYSVVVTIQKNLLPYIDTDVHNGILEISCDDYSFETDSIVLITIYTPSLNEFSLTGVGNVVSDIPIQSIKLSGVGNISCQGETDDVYVKISGSGNVYLFDMPVDDADVNITGTGNISVYVNEYLDVNITGMGNIYYKGNPEIHTSITGMGQVVNSN